MKINLIRLNDLQPNDWSGGKTYEYYIFPKEADYKNKDFLFRISSATIETIPSRFTNFIGYQRFLCMLDNPLQLKINNRENELAPLELIEFKSEDSVVSNAIGNDFNLMIKEDIKDYELELTHGFYALNNDFIIIFALSEGEFFLDNQPYLLNAKDCIVIENIDNKSIDLISGNEFLLGKLNLAHHSYF